MNENSPSLSQFPCFDVSLDQHIGHIKLNRPEKLNSMIESFWLDLPKAVAELEQNTDTRVIVISSTGKHFSAGMDLAVFQNPQNIKMGGDPGRMGENLRRTVMQLQDCLSSLERTRLPVLAAIQGGCIGGALDMVCAADSRYCSEDAYFTIKETEIGMTADVGTLQRLPKLMPIGVVKELAYTGRKFSASEAKDLGFVNTVLPNQDALLDHVMSIAKHIASNSPLAVTGCKEMINYSRDHTVADSLQYMATWQSGMFRPNDMMKAFAAKAQKSAPEYENLFPIEQVFDN